MQSILFNFCGSENDTYITVFEKYEISKEFMPSKFFISWESFDIMYFKILYSVSRNSFLKINRTRRKIAATKPYFVNGIYFVLQFIIISKI